MFVKKLVEIASQKKPGGNVNGIKAAELSPRLVFHYGIPSGCLSLAYDSIQKILAISTKDGRIKLLGRDNTQALLESNNAVHSKFMQFLDNQGILFNVTIQNHIEIWDIERKQLSYVHIFKEEITAFAVIQQTYFMYIGDSIGNVSVFKLDPVTYHLVQMNYNVPLSASHGNTSEVEDDTAVMYIMPQPMAESKRLLIIFRDGLIILWGLEESNVIFVMGGNVLSISNDTKKVTSACWACPFGSKLAVGYSNGEIYIWNVLTISNPLASAEDKESVSTPSVPTCKLNLGYKADKVPILSLKWIYGEGKTSRLYVNGTLNSATANMFQIVLLNEETSSRTIKLSLSLPEPCLDMEIISSMIDQHKKKQSSLLILLKSGHLCTYDDSVIEKFLSQSQSRPHYEMPKELMLKLPFSDSRITIVRFVTNDSNILSGMDEDCNLLLRNFPALIPIETRAKDESFLNSAHFSGFAKIKNLYVTGHEDGAINFWDVSSPLLFPILSVKQQSEDDHSLSGIPVTALYFDVTSRVFVSGDQSGMVRIFKFKPEPFSTENSFFSLQGSSKKGSNNAVHGMKLLKVNGAVLSFNVHHHSKHLAVGSDKGYVYVIDIEGPTILFQSNIASEVCNGIMSLQFETCSLHGFEKNILLLGTKDSSVVALDSETGVTLSTAPIRPKKPAKAIFMQTLEVNDGLDSNGGRTYEDASKSQPLLLFVNEKSVYVYSLIHVVQGVKRVLYKKKFHGTCCWASTFYNHDSAVALALLLPGGRIEIRSLPELSVLNEISVRSFTFQPSKSDSYSDTSLCSSSDGELLLVNGDQEVFFVSLLLRKEIYRFLDPIGHVYQKGMIAQEEDKISGSVIHKEKKKGLFSSMLNTKANKSKHDSQTEVQDSSENIADELSNIFSVANFPMNKEHGENHVVDTEDEPELDIDDIDFEDEKPKSQTQTMIAGLNKQKLTSKFLAIKGKLKQKMMKNENVQAKEEHEDDKVESVDQIKRKYGFSSSGDSGAGKMAENKTQLQENLRKLQGINVRATEMQGTAQSFSTMAKEVLRTAEKR